MIMVVIVEPYATVEDNDGKANKKVESELRAAAGGVFFQQGAHAIGGNSIHLQTHESGC